MENEETLATEENVALTADETGEEAPPQVEETDEQKNERVVAEEAERRREKEERRQQSINKRMDELTADKYEARRLADAERARAEALEKQLQELKAPKSTEPQRDQYESYEDYLRAHATYVAAQTVEAQLQKFQTTQTENQTKAEAERTKQAEQEKFRERARALEKDYPDFKEVMENGEVSIPIPVADMIRKLPDGPLLAYHMEKNPSLADQFWNSPKEMHGFLLGQMTATLKSPSKVSSAPNPGKTVSTAKHGSSNEPPSDPNLYRAWADKNLR